MIDKSTNEDFKKRIQDHFDKQQLKANLDEFIPNSVDRYLRGPFEYIQDNHFKDLNEKKILDYCCGSGLNSVLLSKLGARVTGMDISKESVDIAVKRFKKHNLQDYEFYQMDAHSLNFKDNYFDLVVCYKSLLYLNLDKAFSELNRVMKNDAKLIILENIGDNFIFNYYRFIKHILRSRKYPFELNKLKSKDIVVSTKLFYNYENVYFDFFTILGKFVQDVFKIKISYKFLSFLDKILLRKLKLRFLPFTLIKVLKKNTTY